MVSINPGITTSGLVYYYDLNNFNSYKWNLSNTFFSILSSNSSRLTAAYIDLFRNDLRKRFVSNTLDNRFTGSVEQTELKDFTFQFWLRLGDFNEIVNYKKIIGTQGLSDVYIEENITFEDDQLTLDNVPISIKFFNEPSPADILGTFNVTVSSNGNLGYECDRYTPSTYYSSTLSFYNSADKGWNLFTFVKEFSTFRIYKNLSYEEYNFTSSPSFTNDVLLKGLTTNLLNFDMNHILIYNRPLSNNEIFRNYKGFNAMYQESEKELKSVAPVLVKKEILPIS